jgi:magnesium chelatase subunit D
MKRTKSSTQGKELRVTSSRGAPAAVAYPFSGIVGQEEMKLGLILNVIDPSIGGVLMMGHRGTGKSTAVRALADLLPEISVTRGCLFNCDPNDAKYACADCEKKQAKDVGIQRQRRAVPVVDLPLGATEDRVCGAIDIQRALAEGVKAFEPGLLARANRGFLYIDEVNLLEDHLVDLLLDVAITGRNKVERENISVEHPARFVLIGSGNPEEGELRPQLLDRFGLYVEVKTENDAGRRVEIMEKREAFERNAQAFCLALDAEQKELRQRIARAGRKFATVKVGRTLMGQIATLCAELKVDGHRGELTIMRAARARAAFAGRKAVSEDDVRQVATMSLRHRLHREALSEGSVGVQIEQALDKVLSKGSEVQLNKQDDGSGNSQGDRKVSVDRGVEAQRQARLDPDGRNGADSEHEARTTSDMNGRLPKLVREQYSKRSSLVNDVRGRRAKTGGPAYNSQRGRYARAVSYKRTGARIALDATLRALIAAGFCNTSALGVQHPTPDTPHPIPSAALRFKQFARKRGTLFIFAIDTSGSMALNRISQARGALRNLLRESYINRDMIAIVGFRGTGAEILLPPSSSIVRARRVLDSLSVGGGTPLSAGLACSLGVAQRALNQPCGEVVLLLFTDGGANVPLQSLKPKAGDKAALADRQVRQVVIANEVSILGSSLRDLGVQSVVVETDNGFASKDEGRLLATLLGAGHLRLSSREQAATNPTIAPRQSA